MNALPTFFRGVIVPYRREFKNSNFLKSCILGILGDMGMDFETKILRTKNLSFII